MICSSRKEISYKTPMNWVNVKTDLLKMQNDKIPESQTRKISCLWYFGRWFLRMIGKLNCLKTIIQTLEKKPFPWTSKDSDLIFQLPALLVHMKSLPRDNHSELLFDYTLPATLENFMTFPIATVLPSSRSVNLPSWRKPENFSTQIVSFTWMRHNTTAPVLTKIIFFFIGFFVLGKETKDPFFMW